MNPVKLKAWFVGKKGVVAVERARMGVENAVVWLDRLMRDACDATVPRRSLTNRNRPVYWSTDKIAVLRRTCVVARKALQRARPREALTEEAEVVYKLTRKLLKAEIRNSKELSWRELCKAVDSDPWGLPYKVVTKKIGGRPLG